MGLRLCAIWLDVILRNCVKKSFTTIIHERTRTQGAIEVLRNAIFLEIGPHPTPRNANNIEHYTFVTLFSGKYYHPPLPHLRYVTLEWPPTCAHPRQLSG